MELFLKIIGFIVIVLLIVGIGWWITTTLLFWAWNLVMPALFHLPHITYLQAFGLNIILWIVGGCFRAVTTQTSK
jgi:hypothetical protein